MTVSNGEPLIWQVPLRELKSILVVEDHPSLSMALVHALKSCAHSVRAVSDVHSAHAAILHGAPDLILLDFSLPDGTALDVLEVCKDAEPIPRVIAMSGTATPEESFEMASRYNVCAYLPKPLALETLETSVRELWSTPPSIEPHLKAAVGRIGVRALEESVRTTMVKEAMARSDGSIRGAARLLSISRQLLQHILRRESS